MTDEIDMSIFRPPSAVKKIEEKKWIDNYKPIHEKQKPFPKKLAPNKEELKDFLEKNPNLTSDEIMKAFGLNSKSYTAQIIRSYGLCHLYKKTTDERKRVKEQKYKKILDYKKKNPHATPSSIGKALNFTRSYVSTVLQSAKEQGDA